MKQIKYYHLNVGEVFEEVGSGPEGLSSVEAKRRLLEHGPNQLESVKKRSKLMKFLDQFKSAMVMILLL